MVEQDVIKYLISKFEDKIRTNPLSPEFVKLASYYIIDGKINDAINLLKLGLNFYPSYTTAKLFLGKCYLANRYFYDAKKVFEDILNEHPDMSIAKKYLDITSELSKTEVSRKHEEDIIPRLEFKAGVFNELDFNYNLFPNYDVKDLLENKFMSYNFENSTEFSEFRKVFESPHFFKRTDVKPSLERKRLKNKFEVKIITETLADIFAKQGNYFDALEAYSHLLKIKPDRKEHIESKINEVEVKIQRLINDF